MNWRETEQEIQAMPGNGPVLEELCRLLEAGEAIALVGAGVRQACGRYGISFCRGLLSMFGSMEK